MPDSDTNWLQNKTLLLVVAALLGSGSLGAVGGLSFGNGSSQEIEQVSKTQIQHHVELEVIQSQLERLGRSIETMKMHQDVISRSVTYCEVTIRSMTRQLDKLIEQGSEP